MRKEEAVNLKDEIWHVVNRKGIPINVRVGGNLEAADWVMELMEKHFQIDEPMGVITGTDYDHCPRCNAVVGQSAYYCKSVAAICVRCEYDGNSEQLRQA